MTFSLGMTCVAVKALEKAPGPQHAVSGLAFGELECDSGRGFERAPSLHHPRRATGHSGGEAGVPGVAGGRVELALARAEARAVAKVGEAGRIRLARLRLRLHGAALAKEEPEESVGETLRDVTGRGHPEAEDELDHPRRRGSA
jgi:hypothetical protein